MRPTTFIRDKGRDTLEAYDKEKVKPYQETVENPIKRMCVY